MKKIKSSNLFIYALFIAFGLASIYGIASAAFTPPPSGSPGTTNPTGTIVVANGGTGATTLSGVLIGNGMSAFTGVAPGISGNVLTSNGTTWTSQAPTGGGGSQWTTSGSNIYYNTGNVGIGTATPGYPLDVNGIANIGSYLYARNIIYPYVSINPVNVSSKVIIKGNASQTANIFEVQNSSSVGLLAVDSSGNVGIGTTAPGALLDLGLAGTKAGVLRLAGSTSGNVTIQTAAAAGTATTLTLPAVTGKLLGTGAATSGQYASTKYTATTTLDWANGNVQYIQLTSGAQTFTFANPLDGGRYILILKQPAAGAAGTVTWPATVSWSGGTAPALTAANSKVDIIAFVYDATNIKYYAGSNLNF